MMRKSKGITNLANVRSMFGYLFKESELTANVENSKCLLVQQPCKNFTHLICTAVFSTTFCYFITA